MDDVTGMLERRVVALELLPVRIVALETRVTNELASREWVREELHEIKAASIRVENVTTSMAAQMTQLARQQEAICTTQNTLMKERGEREQREHEARVRLLESQTLLSLIREKWQPILAFILAFGAVMTLVGGLAVLWLRTQNVQFMDVPVRPASKVQAYGRGNGGR